MNAESRTREQFLREYRLIRRAEGRGSGESAYYCALPFKDMTGRSAAMWKMRARTYRCFERFVLKSLERRAARPLNILDLGAGNCWLSYRLSLRGHRVVAVDIFNDELDGLSAAHHYGIGLPTVEADFDQLPVIPGGFDLAVFNSSFHYSTDYSRTLLEVRRCLKPGGFVVILDSPIYQQKSHGDRMVEERHAQFLQSYGFRSDAIQSIEFIDLPSFRAMSALLQIEWRVTRPWYGWRWHTRPLKAWFRHKRPPSRFWILTGAFRR